MSASQNQARIDLHTHSIHSDGSHPPADLVPMALEAGISAIALTDHDTVAGIDELVAAAAGTGLEVVTGVELSSNAGLTDLHILGYFFDPHHPLLVQELDRFREGRRERVMKMI